MSSALGSTTGAYENKFELTIVLLCAMAGTLMQALDTTIANVALPYMQGSLQASRDQITWVLTSYIVAAAIMTAPVGWIAARFGRKNFAVLSLAGFTVASMLCGMAQNLDQIVIFRLIQGVFGAALAPLSQSIMLDLYPAEKRGQVMAIWGMGVMVGPILGPTLGGYLTDHYSWRWVFYVNVPFGIAAVTGIWFYLRDTVRDSALRFDWSGFAVLARRPWRAAADARPRRDQGLVRLRRDHRRSGACRPRPLPLRRAYVDDAEALRSEGDVQGSQFRLGADADVPDRRVILLASSALAAALSSEPGRLFGHRYGPAHGAARCRHDVRDDAGRPAVEPCRCTRFMLGFGTGVILWSMWDMAHWTPSVAGWTVVSTTFIQGIGLGFVFIPANLVALCDAAGAFAHRCLGLAQPDPQYWQCHRRLGDDDAACRTAFRPRMPTLPAMSRCSIARWDRTDRA